ncbi:uncharacterized protein [Lolium perenne]|uniref:uncharacterized protein isoform X2 n=1 Tax=Lolium perenne TaxID=4522 RepID=UPI0021F610BD|nr:uncharacterized protein LOC127331971 isoform X6 [Lolium perenne]XP_051214169.1 uncharacterized protein LOC127331971 isoform X7 [Lolium perenne]XP_051214170.1 uncharacterized protein LOC127331971 isoform X8 [Lolium perenne]XP_051214171.1 uncharacterized protein LOC127331971 isoform X9 [Lolium perenne]XP_051214172.1 uncharacterized protein LOC127331971 isoform X10 [Lolium perenne]
MLVQAWRRFWYDLVKSAKSRVQIQIEWFKVLQIDQDLVRSDFVELNQELGNEFLNETSWGMFGSYHGDNRERQLLSCDTLIPLLDANNSGEEEEVESDEDFIYIVGILILIELKKYRDK